MPARRGSIPRSSSLPLLLTLALVAVAGALALAAPASARQGAVVEIPASIDGSGRRDVTGALNDFIESVPDGATIRFAPGATYRAEGSILVWQRHGLTLDFNGATLIATTDGSDAAPPPMLEHLWPRHRAHLYVAKSSAIVLRDVRVRGPHSSASPNNVDAYVAELEAQHAVELSDVHGALVDGGELSHVYGDAVIVAGDSRDVLVRAVYAHNTGRQGMSVTGGTNIRLEGNRVEAIRRSAFDVEPNASDVIQSVAIVGNQVGRARLSFVAGLGRGSRFDDLLVADNVLVRMPMRIQIRAPEGGRRSNIRIVNNRSDFPHGSTQATMRLFGLDGVEVVGNVQPLVERRRALAVETRLSCHVVVTDNVFAGARQEHLHDGYDDCDGPPPAPPGTTTAGIPGLEQAAPAPPAPAPAPAPGAEPPATTAPPATAAPPPAAPPDASPPAPDAPPPASPTAPTTGTEDAAGPPPGGRVLVEDADGPPPRTLLAVAIALAAVNAGVLAALVHRRRRGGAGKA